MKDLVKFIVFPRGKLQMSERFIIANLWATNLTPQIVEFMSFFYTNHEVYLNGLIEKVNLFDALKFLYSKETFNVLLIYSTSNKYSLIVI